MTKILVTGGCGFIGHHLLEHLMKKTDWTIVVLDKLTYASMGFERLRDDRLIYHPRVKIFTHDLEHEISEGLRKEIGTNVEYIIHLAAETHVDNSIKDPVSVIRNNVMSTTYLLEYARTLPSLKKFFYFSTDEVFGNACNGEEFKEWDRHKPTNPYSASKAASEDICLSYENTYKIPVIIINSMNVFGERQHVEKFIPKIINYLLEGKELEIHSYKDGKTPGTRFYIHARNVSSAILFLIENGTVGEKYNICGEKEVNNLEMALLISKIVGIDLKYKLVNFHTDRPGHDLRYCLSGEKLHKMGWNPPMNFEESLAKTVRWTMENKQWLKQSIE